MTIGSHGYDPRDNALVTRMREEEQERRLEKERETRAEVMQFEAEKIPVTVEHVGVYNAIHGDPLIGNHPIELDDTGRKA